MPRATLLQRESSSKSLKSIVESAQKKTGDDYDIDVRNGQLVLSRLKTSTPLQKQTSTTDEGFESDIDSISLISTDESFTSTSKGQESDSANGSACSDSDDADTASVKRKQQESFNLVNCVCYTDIKFPDTLVFAIKDEALVFRFGDTDELRGFHASFSAIKAVANQKAYGNATIRKFNLLQRTDANGVTHIEISRNIPYTPPQTFVEEYEPSSIISINTPETYVKVKKALSIDNLLDGTSDGLRKVWSSAENLLEAPRKPERRRPKKGPAPQPPAQSNVLQGQFVRVNVLKCDQKLKPPPPPPQKFHFLKSKPFQQFKFSDPKKITEPWCNSMPRLMKKTKSDTRLFTPMAYRYIDTTAPSYIPRYKTPNVNRGSTISNRLFGMSSKLKEFASVQSGCNLDSRYQKKDPRYSSLGNLNCPDGTLKSVIKKDDAKQRKNEKKVTFSAYNTVQVV